MITRFKKFLSFSYGNVIAAVLAFGTTLFITSIISPDEFGKVSMYTTAVNTIMILTVFGTDQAFIRFFSSTSDKNLLMRKLISLPVVISFIITLIVLLFWESISVFLFGEANIYAIGILLIGYYGNIVFKFGTVVIRMKQKGNLYSINQILYRLFILVILFVLYSFLYESYLIVILATSSGVILVSVVSILVERKFWKRVTVESSLNVFIDKELLVFSTPFLFTTLITWLFNSVDKVAIRTFSDFTQLGYYSAAFRVVSLVSILQASFSIYWTPLSYEHFEANGDDKFFGSVSKIITSISVLAGSILILLREFIIMVFGGEYGEASLSVPFLLLIPTMYIVSETTVMGINFMKKSYWHTVISICILLLNVVLNLVLVPRYNALGAAISTGVAYVVFFVLRTIISNKIYRIDHNFRFLTIALTLYISIVFSTLISFQLELLIFCILVAYLLVQNKNNLRIFASEIVKALKR